MAHPLVTLIVASVLMSTLWPLSLKLRDVSIVDILWGPAFALLAAADLYVQGGIDTRGWICFGLVVVWACRLGLHIFLRHRRIGAEDYRYATIRRRVGRRFPLLSLAVIFWLQALLLWIISWPLQAALEARGALTAGDGIGMAMTATGIVVEALADAQLTRFRAVPDHHGRVLDTGLWRWSRHPNYFGDFLIWWGFYVIALAGGGAWWTIVGPVVMTALLVHYSGAGLMEDTIADRRPGYKAYVERTSSFFPWPPRA